MQHTRVWQQVFEKPYCHLPTSQMWTQAQRPGDGFKSYIFTVLPTYDFEVHVESLNRSINWRFSHYKSEFTTLGLVTQDLIYFGSPL